MNVLRSVVAAFACFSTIPMPRIAWDERNMRYMMAAFPLVGVVIGLLLMGWQQLCGVLGVGQMLRGAGLTLVPVAITGGIHLDGLADVTDALSSHAEPARKREILADPHVGAFAVIGVCGYFVAYFALACELDARLLPALACTPVLSRCLAGLAAVSAPLAKREGMLASVSTSAKKRGVRLALAVEALAVALGMMWASPLVGAAAIATAALVLWAVIRCAAREFGGMSGDLSGAYVQLAELAMLACVAFAGRMV